MKFTKDDLELFLWIKEGCKCCCCSLIRYMTIRKESCPCYPGTGSGCYGCLDQILGECDSVCNQAIKSEMKTNEESGDPEDEEPLEDGDEDLDIEEDDNPDFAEEHKNRGTYEGHLDVMLGLI